MIAFTIFLLISVTVLADCIYRLLFPPSTIIVYTPVCTMMPDYRPVGCGVILILIMLFVGTLVVEFFA
jgi:hypothetical protein